MTTEVLFTNTNYEVHLTESPIPIENNGATLYFNYAIVNTQTGRVECHDQFLPAAIEKANGLNDFLNDLTEMNIEVDLEDDGTVVEFNA